MSERDRLASEPGAGTPATPRRLSASEVARALLESATNGRSAGGNVTLERNVKGITTVSVTVRAGEIEEIPDTRTARDVAVELYDELCAKYPYLEPEPPAPKGSAGS